MSQATKGCLLSALVFPGLGQIVLKRYKRGICIALFSLACVMGIVIKSVMLAVEFLLRMEEQGQVIDLSTAFDLAEQITHNTDNTVFTVLWTLLILSWLFGLIDGYLTGKKLDSGLLDKEGRNQAI